MECVVLLTNATDMQPILTFPINARMNQVWVLFVMSPRADFQNCCLDFFFFFKGHFFSSFLKSGTTKEISDGLYTLSTGWRYMSLTKKKNGDVNWYKRGIFTEYNLYHAAILSQWSRDDSRMCYSAAVPVEVWRPRPLSPESFKMTIRRKKETHSFCCLPSYHRHYSSEAANESSIGTFASVHSINIITLIFPPSASSSCWDLSPITAVN